MLGRLKITKPSVTEVKKYLKLWDSLENYVLQENALEKLFLKTYPRNTDIKDVLIKVCSLNDFYSTHILSPFTIAKHIISLGIDKDLLRNDLRIVDRIAKVKMSDGVTRNFYSFATKYCSHQKPKIYPIYDYYVEKILVYFRDKDGFYKFKRQDFKSYLLYRNILINFRKYYNLGQFNLKQIDKYLWQVGKKYFPRKY